LDGLNPACLVFMLAKILPQLVKPGEPSAARQKGCPTRGWTGRRGRGAADVDAQHRHRIGAVIEGEKSWWHTFDGRGLADPPPASSIAATPVIPLPHRRLSAWRHRATIFSSAATARLHRLRLGCIWASPTPSLTQLLMATCNWGIKEG
jgi:hypothetical protein